MSIFHTVVAVAAAGAGGSPDTDRTAVAAVELLVEAGSRTASDTKSAEAAEGGQIRLSAGVEAGKPCIGSWHTEIGKAGGKMVAVGAARAVRVSLAACCRSTAAVVAEGVVEAQTGLERVVCMVPASRPRTCSVMPKGPRRARRGCRTVAAVRRVEVAGEEGTVHGRVGVVERCTGYERMDLACSTHSDRVVEVGERWNSACSSTQMPSLDRSGIEGRVVAVAVGEASQPKAEGT